MDKKIKEENRKALPKFLLIMLAAGFTGGIVGVLLGTMQEQGLSLGLVPMLERGLSIALPWLYPALMVPVLLIHGLTMGKVKKMKAAWDGEEDETPERIDRKTDGLLILHNVTLALVYLTFSASVIYCEATALRMVLVAEMAVSAFLVVFMQKHTIEFIRAMNPEKKGCIFDMKFCKTWTDSCDEAEKKLMGEAAYGVYQVMNRACIIVWAVLIFLQMFAGVGLLPSLVVMGLFVTSQVAFWLQQKKLTKR